jgi:hypothetical protein
MWGVWVSVWVCAPYWRCSRPPPCLRFPAGVQWVIDPYKMAMDSTDLAKNNPLAVDDDAPWQRHFQDEQFRKQIQQDVHRTFPALDYFRRKDVQEDLLNILFCYARSNPSLAYRQGMHELLAGMYYTVACDAGVVDPNGTLAEGDEATTSKKSGSNGNSGESIKGDEARIRSLMKVVVDRDHIPHDAHTLFCVAMETAGGWFAQTQEEVQLQRRKALENHTPFASPSQVDSGAKSIVMVRLDRIHEKLLKTFDSELYHRLQVCVCVCVCVRACVRVRVCARTCVMHRGTQFWCQSDYPVDLRVMCVLAAIVAHTKLWYLTCVHRCWTSRLRFTVCDGSACCLRGSFRWRTVSGSGTQYSQTILLS